MCVGELYLVLRHGFSVLYSPEMVVFAGLLVAVKKKIEVFVLKQTAVLNLLNLRRTVTKEVFIILLTLNDYYLMDLR